MNPSTNNQNHFVYSFPRADGEEVRIGIRDYQNHRYLDLRIWYQAEGEEQFRPTRKGLSLNFDQFTHLNRGIQELSKAVERSGPVKKEYAKSR